MTKVTVRALTTFAHGSLDARPGMTYEMNKGEAHDLEELGLVTIGGDDEAAEPTTETTQPGVSSVIEGAAGVESQPGDVVIEEGADADEKAAPVLDNKMAPAPTNKSRAKGK